jgi:hypothetical protein
MSADRSRSWVLGYFDRSYSRTDGRIEVEQLQSGRYR